MTEIKLFLLGVPRIERGGKKMELGLRKAMAIIAYLAVTRKPQSRDFLAGLLWPETDQATARSNLRRTLYLIQQKLGDDFLHATAENLEISPEANLWLDVQVFDEQVSACLRKNSAAPLRRPDCRSKLEEAAVLYTDDFMSSFTIAESTAFEEWLFFERESLRQKLAAVLSQMVEHYLRNNDPKSAIPHARRWLSLDHLHEPAHRMLMELYARTGQRAAALRQYQECCRLLDESLGLAPQPETTELYEAIKTERSRPMSGAAFLTPEIHYVQSGEVHIAYEVLGTGPVDFLIVPGFVSHLDVIWTSRALAQVLRQLAGIYRLILFDKRGVGLSDRVGYPPTLEHTMDDMLAVLNAVGSERAVLFGFSEGGPNSLVFCAAHPDRVLGLVLYGTLAKGMRAPDYPWALSEEQHAKWLDWLLSVWGRPVPHLYFAPSRAGDNDLWEWFGRLLRLGSSPGGVRAVLEVLKDIDVRHVLATIRTPTLVIHRKADQTMRVEGGRYLAEHIPGAHYVELQGDDHWWWLGDTQVVMKEIETFIAKLEPASAGDQLLATILCAQLEEEKNASEELRHRLEMVFSQEVKKYRGQQLNNKGNVYLATFDGASRAIKCAQTLSRIAQQRGFPLRIVLHSGECILADGQLRGSAVEIAAATIKTADTQQVLASRTVKDLVVGAGFSFESCGSVRLGKGLGTWEFFHVK